MTPIPQAEAANTAIAQLLQAHAKAKAEQVQNKAAAPTVVSNMNKKVKTSTPVVVESEEEDDSEPEMDEAPAVVKKMKRQGLWMPLHRRSALKR